MKPAKPASVDAPSHRRSQPSRQARTNPSRSSANAGRSGDSKNAANGLPLSNRPVDIFPAITHFADTMSALPKELVRHFTLLKEVDAKIFAPEQQLFKLVAATTESSTTEPRATCDASSTAPPGSAPMSTQDSLGGMALNRAPPSSAPSISSATAAPTSVFDPSNIPRRQIFRRTAFKIQEMLVSLEEKNHVLSTANEALQRQLARVEDVWPHLENEFSDEAKWGSTTHWAYPENRAGGKVSQTERIRRDGAAAISAAAQALAEEAAARSDARKQAVQAKKNLKNQHQDSDADDVEKRQKEAPKKTAKSRKTAAIEANSVGSGVSASTTNGNHPPKRRKVEKAANGEKATSAAAVAATTTAATSATAVPAASSASTGTGTGTGTTNTTYNAAGNGLDAGVAAAFMSMVFGNNAPKPKTSSPKGTPAPDGQKKRKALPTGNVQAKKKNGMSPSTTSSPVMGPFPDPKVPAQASPAPSSAPRPASSRARQNSIQSNVENSKARPSSSAAANKTNGDGDNTPEPASTATLPKSGQDSKPTKEEGAPIKTELIKKETEKPESASTTTATSTSSIHNKDGKPEEADQKSESVPAPVPPPVTTKSGRASKPSTPALATFQEAAAAAAASRSRPSRAEGTNSRKSHKKSGPVAQQPLIQQVQAADTDASSSMQGDDEEGDIDADEPTYCYCNSVSYGEMVACDADGCEREWFHLACVGLKVAPGSKTKWYCEDCKDRLKIGNKKTGR